MFSSSRSWLLAAAGLLLGFTADAAPIGELGILDDTANGGINPATGVAWAPGDTYRFAFITSTDGTALETDIAVYNANMQALANASSLGIGAAEGVSWVVIGSTSTVDARDNTQTNPGVNGSGVPILLLDGTTVVANDYNDLWDGSLQNTISIDENGSARDFWPFTGTFSDGTRSSDHNASYGALGDAGQVGQGQSSVAANWVWRTWTGDPPNTLLPFYAMSDELRIRQDADGDGFAPWEGDCDDSDPNNYPGNTEVCDGQDNDCDGQSDEGLTFDTYWDDGDGDGWGLDGTEVSACSVQPGATQGGDCEDGNAAINPGAAELCDGLDNDCNGANDFGGGGQEIDFDGDGFLICENDCNDTNGSINPIAIELCDGLDNDCNGAADFGAPGDEDDDDGDSYRVCDGDCNDDEPLEYPGNPEVCDGLDNDCLSGPDDGLSFANWWVDDDGDGFGDENASALNTCLASVPGSVTNDADCNDADPGTNPNATESCNSADDDCDGQVDEGTVDQDWYADTDGDGFGDGPSTGFQCGPPSPTDVPNDLDCNDADPAINPNATEICDAVDHDCDGDPENGLTQLTWWVDADGDGFGDPLSSTTLSCAQPAGRTNDDTDCDDSSDAVNPSAFEICDGIDNDCNGLADVDDGLPTQSYYDDPDGDGWGSGTPIVACAPVPGRITAFGDCDEADPAINPGATEICDDLDNDCSGLADDGLPTFDFYTDADGDGWGDGLAGTDCAPPSGSAAQDGDCDDADPTIFPGAVEQCDTEDNDCNGLVDDNVQTTDWYDDLDGDGYGGTFSEANCLQPAGTIDNDLDCDDDPTTGPSINPGATEVCDTVDNDCDGDVDDDDADLVATAWYIDADADGYGDSFGAGLVSCLPLSGTVDNALDCADGDPAINPAAVEACPDGIDNDCDGLIDADDPNYTDQPVIYWFDQDGDGVGTPALTVDACSGNAPPGFVPPTNGLDCDDSEFAIYPGAAEFCDGLDNDCNGTTDEGLATEDYFPDLDGDGYGDASQPMPYCSDLLVPNDLIAVGLDCDDADPGVNPDALEDCNGVDDDCDGVVDDGLTEVWYPDADGDGFGGEPYDTCLPDPTDRDSGGDCDDSDPLANPDAPEICSGADNDCNGIVDDVPDEERTDFFQDADGDGLGDAAVTVRECLAPEGFVDNADDCDDDDPAVLEFCPDEDSRATGCKCASTSAPSPLGLLLFLVVARRRMTKGSK